MVEFVPQISVEIVFASIRENCVEAQLQTPFLGKAIFQDQNYHRNTTPDDRESSAGDGTEWGGGGGCNQGRAWKMRT